MCNLINNTEELESPLYFNFYLFTKIQLNTLFGNEETNRKQGNCYIVYKYSINRLTPARRSDCLEVYFAGMWRLFTWTLLQNDLFQPGRSDIEFYSDIDFYSTQHSA